MKQKKNLEIGSCWQHNWRYHCITTFTNWRTEIANIIDESVSNGFIEGSNNKIKVLKRISYGVRNFERFRNRILYL